MRRIIRAKIVALRGSLFLIPVLFVVAAIGIAQGTLILDASISESGVTLPTLISATVDSARALLSTVAAATITFAGIAFSVSLLMFQLAASQYSPRVLYGLFRDPLTKRAMGTALGTFTYSLLVLRAVRAPLEEGGSPVVPHASVLIAVVLGIVSVVAILAFINQVAHSMEAAEIIRRITEDTHEQIAKICPNLAGDGPKSPLLGSLPDGPSLEVRSQEDGWVQAVDVDGLFRAAEPGGVIRLDAGAGVFVPAGTRLCTIWPRPENEKAAARTARIAIELGRTRTMQQDLSLGFRQLADVALRALSPGVNDPTTAREAMVHIGSALQNLLTRDLPPRVLSDQKERRLYRPNDYTHEDYVNLAFDEIRQAGAEQPGVIVVLLRVMGSVATEIEPMAPARADLVRRKARLALEAFERSGPLEADLATVREVAGDMALIEADGEKD